MAAEPDVARGEPSIDDLKRQLNEALQHQAATNELLEVIRRSASDFQSVLDALLAAAARLCGVEAGGVAIREGEVFRYLATVGMNAEFDAVMRGRTYIPGRGTAVGRVALEKRVVHIVDAQADPDYEMSETITVGRLRTMLSVPMMQEGEVVGAITLARRQVEPFSERQIALIKTFADQAVIAMENARLLGELSEALDRQQATSEVLQVINASLGQLKPVFDALLEKATSFCEAAFGILWTYDGENYRAAALRKVPPAYAKYLREPPPLSPEAPLGRIAAGESLAHIPDMAVQMFERSPLMRHAVELGGFRTVLGVALRKEGMLLGAITIYRQEVRLFSDKQIALLQNFAAQAVIAMENARLLTEQHRALEQQKATSEVLAIISASPENLEPVFSTILSNAITLCQAELGNLFLFEDDTFRV